MLHYTDIMSQIFASFSTFDCQKLNKNVYRYRSTWCRFSSNLGISVPHVPVAITSASYSSHAW